MTAGRQDHYAEDARPDAEQTASLLYEVLAGERGTGFLPENVAIGVLCSAERDHVFVQIGGLSDTFVLGRSTELRFFAYLEPDACFTAEARQLRYRVLDLARETLPRKASGELWFATDVWLMTEPFWRSPRFAFDGVTILGKGNPR
ncbi:hypothetical protein ACQPW3_08155 [Actinosynnema sp. CA-248983]